MAGTSLLALIDDIATLLDDVAVLSKVAAKKTAGVLGDDLALNAEQVSGVRAERELPVVWAVAKGSMLNKVILVPAALAISAIAPWAVLILLMMGGAYLCFEGFEKIAHKYLHPEDVEKEHKAKVEALAQGEVDLVAMENKKIKGAIRTDFILSAEIIVIVLGTVSAESFSTQVAVLSFLAFMITVGVYGIVAAIVKIDDLGLYLLNTSDEPKSVRALIGKGLLLAAPKLMKLLSIVGTIAMFMVGGGILVHGITGAEALLHHWAEVAGGIAYVGGAVKFLLPTLLTAIGGVIAGGCLVAIFEMGKKLFSKSRHA